MTILITPEATSKKGNTRNPGIGTSLTYEMHTNNEKISMTGLQNIIAGIICSERKELKDLSKIWA